MRVWNGCFAILLAALAACSGDDEDPGASLAQRACERLDECNALAAGHSVDECTSAVQHDLDDLSPDQRHDAELMMNGCLEFQTCSAFLDCASADAPGTPPGDEPPPPPPPPPAQSGRFSLAWSIEHAGTPLSCADVGADTVRLHSFHDGQAFLDIFDCAAFQGTTDLLPAGSYTAFITIHQGETELGRSADQAATLGAGQVVMLQGVTWEAN